MLAVKAACDRIRIEKGDHLMPNDFELLMVTKSLSRRRSRQAD